MAKYKQCNALEPQTKLVSGDQLQAFIVIARSTHLILMRLLCVRCEYGLSATPDDVGCCSVRYQSVAGRNISSYHARMITGGLEYGRCTSTIGNSGSGIVHNNNSIQAPLFDPFF